MFRKLCLIIVGCGILTGCQTSMDSEDFAKKDHIHLDKSKLPTPPKNFSWKVFPSTESAILVPNNWTEGKKKAEGVNFSAFNKVKGESVAHRSRMNFSVVENTMKRSKVSPVEFLMKMGKSIIDHPNNKVKLDNAFPRYGLFHLKLIYEVTPVGMEPVMVHQYMVADERRDRIYMATFESLSKYWEEEWKVGEQVMGNIVFPAYQR